MPQAIPKPFERLIEPHLPVLYRVAWRLAGNRPDAEDLVQDTCVRACQSLAVLASAEHPDRWLIRVLYNCFVDGSRRQERSPVVAIDDRGGIGIHASTEPGPEVFAEQADSERRVLAACARLSESHRALLSLRAEGYGLAEIEEIAGISRQVLRARLHRARLSLAGYLEEQTEETEPQSCLGSKP
jgi:RNA polymerase sigma-70 factor (ECF subfamily)